MKSFFFILQILSLLVFSQSTDNSNLITHYLNTFVSKKSKITLDHTKIIYDIQITRQSTTTPDQIPHCFSTARKIDVKHRGNLFELKSIENETAQQNVYKTITQFDDGQQIIQFQSINKSIYITTTANKIYFLTEIDSFTIKQQGVFELPKKVGDLIKNKNFFLLTIDYGVLLIFPNAVFVCSDAFCKQIQGWNNITQITHAEFVKYENKRYIMITQDMIGLTIYKLSNSNVFEGHKLYDPAYFGVNVLRLYDISTKPIDKNQIYVLDHISGLYSIDYSKGDFLNLPKPTKILNRSNCYAIDINGYKYFILNCQIPNTNTNFLIEVYHLQGIDQYVQHKPNYKYEIILDVELSKKYYVTRGYSGLKFYWSSDSIPYPREYQEAGYITLAHAVQCRFKYQQNKNYLYIATLNTLKKYQIIEKLSTINCFSLVPTKQQYIINYNYQCTDDKQKICKRFERILYNVWKHRQIHLYKAVIPVILSIFGVFLIVSLIKILMGKYRRQLQSISLRYSAPENEFGLESNR